MAKIYVKNTDGTYTPQSSVLVSNLDIVQDKGDSLISAMSQKAVTDELANKQDTIIDLDAIRRGAEKGSTALQSESDPIYTADKPNLALKSELDGKVDKEDGKVLSSNDYTDAEKAKLTELEKEVLGPQVIDVTGTGTFQVGRVFTSGINTSYTNYRYMLFDAKKGDIIHYKTMADSNTLVFGLQNSDGITFTKIQNGAGTPNYVEGDYPVSEDSGFVICGLNNIQTLATITRDGRILLLETEVAEINEEIPGVRNSIKNIEIGIGVYKVDENLMDFCTFLDGKYINYNGSLINFSDYNVAYLPVENASQIKNKGAFGGNTAIAFYSDFPFSSSNLVEIHKYSDYSPEGKYMEDEITLSVPDGAKYFAFTILDSKRNETYVKASVIGTGQDSLNSRLMTVEKEDISGIKASVDDIKREIGLYQVDKNLIGICSVITNKYISYKGELIPLTKYNTYLLPIENATQIKVKGGFGLNTAIAFYSSKDLNATNLVEIHKYSDYIQGDEGYYTDEITLSVPSGAKYFAFPVWDTYNTSAYVKASQLAEQTESINTRISTLEEGASAFFIDPTLHLEGITDNPLALIKKNGGLASAFESWGFIGDSLASGEIWGWKNVQKTLVGAKTDKMVDATGNIIDATGYIISEPLQGQTYKPKFVVEFANNTGLSSSMCIVARCDASGNILAVGAVGSTATKYTFSVSDNQYVVVCYPSGNVPSVRCVSNYVWDNYDISWGQYMCRICGSKGVNYSVGGGTAKKFVLGQSPFSPTNSLAKLKSDSQKQGYILAFGVNDKGNAIYNGNVTDINNIGADVNLTDPTQNANTFAGYYARVIQEIKNTFQDSFIFLVTIPESSGYDEMNTIIRAMPGIFEGTYNSIYLLDLKKFLPESAISQFRMNGLHLNAQGYAYFAYTFCTYIDWLIRTYPNEFKGISLVGKALLVNPS